MIYIALCLLSYWMIGVLVGMYYSRVQRTRQEILDADGNVYLIRYFLWKPDWLAGFGINPKKAGRIYLHNIIRSDHDRCLHSHPWRFLSVMLSGGYREWADIRQVQHKDRAKWTSWVEWPLAYRDFTAPCLLRRGAGWRHRLELLSGSVWTLVFIGKKVREWGFFTDLANNKECHWTKYDTATGICEEVAQ